ncbi:MAG TPA: iron-containing redox enzyme family protein [Actinomycetales bacterium]
MISFSSRGPLSAALLQALAGAPTTGHPGDDDSPAITSLVSLASAARATARPAAEVLADDDLQLTLYLAYELHYGGLPGVDDGWEWEPALITARRDLEAVLERALRERHEPVLTTPSALPRTLFSMAAADSGPSLAGYVARHATVEQVAEVLVLRSPYQLKEGDPQTFAIPRLHGRSKAALVEIQGDEYGGGHVDRMHATLFRNSMRALGLDDTPNGYLDLVPAVVLASHNALSLFALNRRLRGALCGHLAVFEMTSSLPAKRWVSGMQRLGLPTQASEFFDEHIEADAVHEQIAAHDLCGALVRDEPALLDDVLLGASTCLTMDALVSEHVLSSWERGSSALRAALPAQRELASA